MNCEQHSPAQILSERKPNIVSENAVNINSASAEELEKLPRVGQELAKRIVEHREKYGKFRRSEHLILVRGISGKKFRDLQDLVKAE